MIDGGPTVPVRASRVWMSSMGILCLTLLCCVEGTKGQESPNAGDENFSQALRDSAAPSSAYLYALQPVQLVRRSPGNLTDAERHAWSVTMSRAAHACAVRTTERYAGEELFALARLCALATNSTSTRAAVLRYLAQDAAPNADLARALLARTYLRDGRAEEAGEVVREMLERHHYEAVLHTVTQEVATAFRTHDERSARRLLARRHAALLAAIQQGSALRSRTGDFEVTPAVLFRDALSLAAMYRHTGKESEASYVYEQVAQALSEFASKLERTQLDAIGSAAKRFVLLGEPAPKLFAYRTAAGSPEHAVGELPFGDQVTVLVFFTSWCPPCFDLMPDVGRLSKHYKAGEALFYAVSTPTVLGEEGMTVTTAERLITGSLKNRLAELPFLLLADPARAALGVEEYPTVAVIDGKGVVRFLEEVSAAAFAPGSYAEKLIGELVHEAHAARGEEAVPSK
jgi:thiol-disulfide isomerase/thioredoxin